MFRVEQKVYRTVKNMHMFFLVKAENKEKQQENQYKYA